VIAGARERIRESHARTGRRIAVIDDDPTGSQTVHGAMVVTAPDAEAVAAALAAPGSTCFILTNTRSLSEAEAVRANSELGRSLLTLAGTLGAPIDIVSRSDSTLRGHFFAEVSALMDARRDVAGAPYDGVLVVPSYFEAGRSTAGDVHRATVDGEPRPVGETEFARDATFGYRASNLREFVAEKSGGAVAASDVGHITLEDVRTGGPERVAEILAGTTGGRFVVVNATDYSDLEVVVLGLLEAEAAGRSFLSRSGPSFVRALAGMEPRDPLTPDDLWRNPLAGDHGMVVVGSHVGLTTRQVDAARSLGGFAEIGLDVPALLGPERDAHIGETAERVIATLTESDVLLMTSRSVVTGADGAASLDIARAVSGAIVDIVRRARAARPAWVVAKGGITSHDVAVHGMGIRRAEVLGQLLPGMISVWRPLDAHPEAVGTPYVVFAGNVGDESTLAHVVEMLRGAA
jgi:uncharacterized protein YgbK (DUF1537 family)